jgi:hypothetical protein
MSRGSEAKPSPPSDYDWRDDSHACYVDWIAWRRFLIERGIAWPVEPERLRGLIDTFLKEH